MIKRLPHLLSPLAMSVALLLAVPVYADVPAADATASAPAAESGKKMTAEEFLATLHYQSGKIALPGGIATLNLPDTFKYLSPADTRRVLEDAWGNPPSGEQTLGMVVPAAHDVLSQEGWGVIITYNEDGHVKDSDADQINYDDLLKDMQKQTEDQNAERTKSGYPAATLVGWAEKPTYNKDTHKFYWAKELSVSGAPEHTLNYNIRVLGRKGVLVLTAVSGMSQMSDIKAEMPAVLNATEFTPGNTYNDFDSKTDHVAEYGLAALVAGGVAAKLGLFGKLMLLLIALKKVIVIAAIAVAAWARKLFGRKKAVPVATTPVAAAAAPVPEAAPVVAPEVASPVTTKAETQPHTPPSDHNPSGV